jgi:hypothetical protein
MIMDILFLKYKNTEMEESSPPASPVAKQFT